MLSRLQELRKEEETLLRLKAALHDQLNRLKVEELALQSMISSRRGDETLSSQPAPEQSHDVRCTSEQRGVGKRPGSDMAHHWAGDSLFAASHVLRRRLRGSVCWAG
ncbi:snRNA-activating protein complex subunit 5 isoform X1 [Mirounga leonina]|uniref:snRNA-activating protein complex subunit 5 isoform X1 n=1 Tax=Mirounga leonina TaxID=9715 RepID=UPI00156C59F9|nr:snRNA-activating protein complex subunit 5 isoform X1 [Mirounga leonina]